MGGLSGTWAYRNVVGGAPSSALQWSGWGRGLAVEQLLRRHSRSRDEHLPLSNNWPGSHPIDGGRIRRSGIRSLESSCVCSFQTQLQSPTAEEGAGQGSKLATVIQTPNLSPPLLHLCFHQNFSHPGQIPRGFGGVPLLLPKESFRVPQIAPFLSRKLGTARNL